MNAMNPCSRSSIDVPAQRGIVLVMVLMFLVVLTLLGMAAMRGTRERCQAHTCGQM